MSYIQDLINEEVDLKRLIEKLEIDESEVTSAAREQPKLLLEAVRLKVQKARRKRKLISELEIIRTEKALQIRRRDSVKGRKRTESNIKELLLQDPDIRRAMTKVHVAEEIEDYVKGIKEAFEHRGKMIPILEHAFGMENAVERRMQDRQTLKSKYPGQEQ